METCALETAHAFRFDLGLAEEEAGSAVVSKRAKAKDSHWMVWENFIATFNGKVDPYLTRQPQRIKLHFLQVFATRLRRGIISPSGNPIRSCQVADYLRTVGSEIALVDENGDPRYGSNGLHPRVGDLQRAYKKEDPPPERVKPIPIQLVRHAADSCAGEAFPQAIVCMMVIGFFFMLRPGEYTYDKRNNHPFRLMDVSFATPDGNVNATTITQAQLDAATAVHLEFTTQKNGEKGEAITHGDTVDSRLSPLKAIKQRVLHLRSNNASATTPLHQVYLADGTTRSVRPSDLTGTLRNSCRQIGNQLGITCKEISAQALRAGGAMALLRAKIDSSIVRMMGRWKSWAMLCYLHRSANNSMPYAQLMLNGGHYTIARHATLPADVQLSAPSSQLGSQA